MNTNLDIGQAIASAARSINHTRSLDETLQAIAYAARQSVPGFDQVGISTLHKSGKVQSDVPQADRRAACVPRRAAGRPTAPQHPALLRRTDALPVLPG
jgi:hypothetical protein